MKIYQGPNLTISFEKKHSRFIQNWNKYPLSIADFKKEMIEYTTLYKKFKPTQSLWLQQNFTLNLDITTQNWIEKQVNIPCKEYGNKKLAFVVSQNVLSHIEVINSFEELNSCIVPKHFLNQKEAENWLNGNSSTRKISDKPKITFEGNDFDGNSVFKISTSNSDISKTLKSFKEIIDTNEFIKNNAHKYLSLTKREKEILHKYSKNQNLKEISKNIFISEHTIRTHWKNIKYKLKLNSIDEILSFSKIFNPRKVESYLKLVAENKGN